MPYRLATPQYAMPWFRHLHIIAHFIVLSRGFFVFLAIFDFYGIVFGQAEEKAAEGAAVKGDERVEVAVACHRGFIGRHEDHKDRDPRDIAVNIKEADKQKKQHPHKLKGIAHFNDT